MGNFSTFLFARPSFIEGAARLTDFGNTLFEYNVSESAEAADYRAFLADWRAIGFDIQDVMRRSSDVEKFKTS